MIELLTSYGPINTLELYEQLIRNKTDEEWWEAYGEELGGVVLSLRIEYVPVPPKPKKSKKRALDSVPEDNTNKRAKNTRTSTNSDPAHSQAVVESDPTCSFRVNPQPPVVDTQAQSSQAPPVLATFRLSSTNPPGHHDSASALASTSPQTQPPMPGASVLPPSVY
ncbi:hypothetical protein FRC07_003801 [Ceratobasidium sp. 392]|nr:hypothetical protein FRC07_003801 [Ceratobasidium sp. 392]